MDIFFLNFLTVFYWFFFSAWRRIKQLLQVSPSMLNITGRDSVLLFSLEDSLPNMKSGGGSNFEIGTLEGTFKYVTVKLYHISHLYKITHWYLKNLFCANFHQGCQLFWRQLYRKKEAWQTELRVNKWVDLVLYS